MITYKIGDLFDLEAGYAFKSKDFTETGIPVLKIKNVKANSIPLHNLSYVEKNFLKTKKDKLARKGDILITMSGNRYDGTKDTWVGKVAEFKHEGLYFINQRVGALRPKPTAEIDISYCSYFLSSEGFQNRFIAIATSSGGQANLSPDQILNEKIALPSIRNQKAVGYILSALDDKIKNNSIINKTLEEMAQTIFRSWFVDFDPVHAKIAGNLPAHMDAETAALFPNSFGDDGLPSGWNYGTYDNAMSIHDSKRVPLSKFQRERKRGVFPYYGATSCMDYVDEYLFDGVYLLMGEDGSVVRENGTPFLQYVWDKFWVNNHAHVLQGANGFSTEHLFCGLSLVNVTPYVTGAVQLKINQTNMKQIPIVIPTRPILKAFNDIILPFFDKRRSNIEENQYLIQLRDTLLPKLISGEIRVKDAEHEVEAAI